MKMKETITTVLIIITTIAVVIFEQINPENTLTEFAVWMGRTVIITYAVHQAILLIAGKTDDMLEALSGFGGIMYLIGVHLWLSSGTSSGHNDLDLLLRVVGVAFMLLPRVFRVAKHALMGT